MSLLSEVVAVAFVLAVWWIAAHPRGAEPREDSDRDADVGAKRYADELRIILKASSDVVDAITLTLKVPHMEHRNAEDWPECEPCQRRLR